MSHANLAICLGPNILKPQEENIDLIVADADAVKNIVSTIFQQGTKFFNKKMVIECEIRDILV